MITLSSEDTIRLEKSRRLYGFYLSWVADRFEETIHAPHIQKLSKCLEDLEKPTTKNRLGVAMPPQHSKSSLVTVAYPGWSICRNQDLRILIVNAEKELSTSFGIQIRNLLYNIKDYVDFKVSDVKSSSTHLMFEDQNGELCLGEIRLTGKGGSITGHPVDVLIIDDPYKGRDDDFTPTQIEKDWDWFTTLIEQRLRPGGILILLHTRWHSEDIQGRILSDDYQRQKYTFVELPAIATENDILGRKPGEPLWPSIYSLDFYRDKERTMGERRYQAIYQQKPLDLTGDFFYTDHIIWDENYIDQYSIANCRSYDMAYTEEKKALKTNADYTAGCYAEKIDENYYIFNDFIYKRLGAKNIKKIQNIAQFDGLNTPILIETGTTGGAAEELFRLWDKDYLTAYNCKQSKPIGTKADRATALKNAIYDGKIHIYCQDQKILKELKSQFESFPNGKRDDLIDAMAYAYTFLKDKSTGGVRTGNKRKRRHF